MSIDLNVFSERVHGTRRSDLAAALNRRGLLSRAGSTIALAPPLCIRRGEVDEIVGIVDDAIGEVESDLKLS